MEILLTTPYDPGDADPEQTYARMKIRQLKHSVSGKEILCSCQYGNLVEGEWVPGVASDVMWHSIHNTDTVMHYDNLVSQSVVAGELVWTAPQKRVYQWLIDEGKYSGTID